ncbi:carcinoembryonic antigen-related cell adhesion molecule 5 [Astyanax mexicanus]|uniref:carcinoembryonic antigen-related cell adhesion molecule 5 n=1 Tax=Astyanax mexicanus TaxID=7994 RepID=UPI0020CAF47E|nr:carcinoembryonic antigen-related cell adhesion molecule 5 [Astyanax mexicanus]
MDLYNLRLPLLIFTAIVCCSCNTLVPPNVSGVKGKYVTFPLTIPPSVQVSGLSWFKGSSSSNNNTIFKWASQKETIIQPPYAGRIVYNQTSYELQLGPLTSADSGTYSVAVVDTNINVELGQTTLEVLDPVAEVTITSSLNEAVEFNSTVILTCSAKGSFLTYKWLNGSTPVVADGKHLMVNASQLFVAGVFRKDLQGPIYCTVQNQLESSTSPAFSMNVSYGPENLAMMKVPDAAFLKKDSNLTLSCSAVSSPAAELKWFFNGAELPQKGTTLALTSLEEKHSGNYSCVAFNSKTMRYAALQAATVLIIEPISGTNITAPTSLLIAGNTTVNLTCKASKGKADSVTWLKDDKPLMDTNRIVYTSDKTTLTIITVQKEDAGNYKCQLTNKMNSDSSIYTMAVNYGPEKASITGPSKVEVEDTVELKCIAPSFPPSTYTWKFNDTLLEITTAEYKIEKPVYSNSGIYTCEARNSVTGLTQKATHNLKVKGVGELNDQLSDGAIAGIVIAVLLLVAIIIAVIIHKRRKTEDIASPY